MQQVAGVGMAALKRARMPKTHAPAQEQEWRREESAGNARLAQRRAQVIANRSLAEPKNRQELRLAARLAARAVAGSRPMTLAELCAFHLRRGTLDRFLRSLEPG